MKSSIRIGGRRQRARRLRRGLAFGLLAAALSQAASAFDFGSVRERAEALAAAPYSPPSQDLPAELRDLTYDQYRDIRFRPDRSLWRDAGLPFQVQYFHRGFFFRDRIDLNVVADGRAVPIAYDATLFDFGRNTPPASSSDLGLAGFRLNYPIIRPDRFDEVAVFLGASYFRAIGKDQNFGLSARGLAIDTGLAKAEEFPIFREFWLEKPQPGATSITVYALLDSESVAGAYRFVITPGPTTVMEITAVLYFRKAVEKLGVAPLTSMYFHGELGEHRADDFRPEVHDSDGLLIAAGGGERIWRPIGNPGKLRVTSFGDTNPRGFGLLQRDRDFDHYQDLEAHYETRPSAWIEPQGLWGAGSVELIEIPSQAERYDNVVAFWTPAAAIQGKQRLDFTYRLMFMLDVEQGLRGGRTVSTRAGAGGSGEPDETRRRFVIDFEGERLHDLAAGSPVEAVVSASTGEVENVVVTKNTVTDGWRLSFELAPVSGASSDLRAYLHLGSDVLTETWSFHWTGNR